ncbi:MAG TPA: flagellar biosynthetic protein FliO [Noviherbaspirillum sp.]
MKFLVWVGLVALLLAMQIGVSSAAEIQAGASAPANNMTVSSAIPYKREEATPSGDLSRFVAGITVCGLVLAGILFFLKRQLRLPGAAGARRRYIELLETQRIGTRATLHAVRFADSVYLIAQSEHGVTAITSTEANAGDSERLAT